MLQVRDAEDVGELDVNWREELHDNPPYEASILPNRVTACASGWKMRGRQSLPSAIISGFVILSWDYLCPIERWRSSIGCIHQWPIANASRLIPQWQWEYWLWVLRFWCRQEVCVNIVLNVKRQWLWILTWCDCMRVKMWTSSVYIQNETLFTLCYLLILLLLFDAFNIHVCLKIIKFCYLRFVCIFHHIPILNMSVSEFSLGNKPCTCLYTVELLAHANHAHRLL